MVFTTFLLVCGELRFPQCCHLSFVTVLSRPSQIKADQLVTQRERKSFLTALLIRLKCIIWIQTVFTVCYVFFLLDRIQECLYELLFFINPFLKKIPHKEEMSYLMNQIFWKQMSLSFWNIEANSLIASSCRSVLLQLFNVSTAQLYNYFNS